MSGFAEILVVAVIIGVALGYLLLKGYRRITSRSAGCGSCGTACGNEPQKPQVVESLEMLTVITADDRR